MSSASLENLVKIGLLDKEAPDSAEVEGLLQSARAKLKDARHGGLSIESRFELAYAAAHAASLAALRRHRYRPQNRAVVFQALAHTLGMPDAEWRLLSLCHERRNAAHYEGKFTLDEKLMAGLLKTADTVLAKVTAL